MNAAPAASGCGSDAGTRPACAGRLVHKVDFERLLGTPGRWRSAHFALHHVSAMPSRGTGAFKVRPDAKLSTPDVPARPQAVDNFVAGHWLGVVVPKRHARRAVTRSLFKRQMRSAMQGHAATLAPGLWLLRLRQPFGTSAFPSAASHALAQAVRQELVGLMQRAASAHDTAQPRP